MLLYDRQSGFRENH